MVEVHGEERLEAISDPLRRAPATVDQVPAGALFIFIGAEPSTDWLDGVVERDERGFILTGPDLMPDGQAAQGLDRSIAIPACSRPACPASSPWAMCGTAR